MIRFENVTKRFGEREVLKGLSFQVNQGEIVFIIGTSGTGKSVLLKHIVGLMKPEVGSVWIDEDDVCALSEVGLQEIRKKCGMIFQHPALFDSMTVYENVAYGIRRHLKLTNELEIGERVSDCLRLVHLAGIEAKLPTELSYGMQKRVSLARTIAYAPRILLFDEPTTGLDPVTTTAINRLIQDLSHKLHATSIVVSHDMKSALSIANRIVVLDQGQIVEDAAPEKLKHSSHALVKEFLAEVLDD